MKRTWIATLLFSVFLTLSAAAQKFSTPEAQLGAIINQAEVEGKYETAIPAYKKFLAQNSKNKALAAKAQYHLALAYEHLGNAEARRVYERIAGDFADQKDIAADAARRLTILNVPRGSDKPATRLVSADGYASMSMDGKLSVFTDKSGDVAVRDEITGQVTPLKAKPDSSGPRAAAETPVFSLDTQQIAFAWFTGEDLTDKASSYQLRIMPNRVGANPRVLVNSPEFIDIWASWFPDGKSILATVEKRDKTWQLIRVATSDGRVTPIKSLDWRLPGFFNIPPSLSPDGRYVAYSAFANNPKGPGPDQDRKETQTKHIYVLPLDGSGSETEVVKTASLNIDPVWTSDGTHILFVSNLSGKSDLWSVPVRDGKQAGPQNVVMRDIGGDFKPIGVTRSNSFYYVQYKDGFEQVSIAELAASGGSRVTESFVGLNPTWSPDGKSLAFMRRKAGNMYDLVVRSVATGEEKIYRRDGLRDTPPKWFHDSLGVLVDGGLPGSSARTTYLLDVKSGEFKQILPENSRSGNTTLSPDDKTLYALSGDSQKTNAFQGTRIDRIVAFDLSTGTRQQVMPLESSEFNTAFGLSPDGRMFAIARFSPAYAGPPFSLSNKPEGELHLAVARIDGSDYHEICAPIKESRGLAQVGPGGKLTHKLAWTSDGRAILFATATGDLNWQIMRIRIDGGKPEYLGVTIKALNDFDLSPDGARIAFSTTASGNPTSQLMAIENLSSLLKGAK